MKASSELSRCCSHITGSQDVRGGRDLLVWPLLRAQPQCRARWLRGSRADR